MIPFTFTKEGNAPHAQRMGTREKTAEKETSCTKQYAEYATLRPIGWKLAGKWCTLGRARVAKTPQPS